MFPLNEDVLCLYADLDSLIERCGLSGAEHDTLKFVMDGYSLADIAEQCGKARQTVEIFFNRAVKKIVRQNNADWEKTHHAVIED